MIDSIWTQQSSLKYRGGFPLRTPEEVAQIMFNFTKSIVNNSQSNTIITQLGVTPEITKLPWAENTTLKAFDRSIEAIKSVWVPNSKIKSTIQEADWTALPLQNKSVHFVLGDGCTTQIDNMNGYKPLFSELRRVLIPDGGLIMRVFVRPEQAEPLDKVITDVLEGKIEHFGSLKWRVAMSLTGSNNQSEIKVAVIYDTFQKIFPDRKKLAQLCDWPLEIINTLDVYKNSEQSYTFPTLLEFKNIIAESFHINEIKYASHELSECCPILSMKTTA